MSLAQPGRMLSLLVLALVATSCGKAKHLEGRVVNESGVPLEGATVQVVNTTFTTQTDRQGDYSLDYPPGNIQVVYGKERFFVDTLSIAVTTKTYYPVREVKLLRIPEASTLMWVSPKGYVPIPATHVEETVLRAGRTIFDREVRGYAPTGEPTIIDSQLLRFLDSMPDKLTLFEVQPNGMFATISYGTFGLGAELTATYPKEDVRRHGPSCVERTSELNPGDYTYATISSQGMVEKPGSTCHFFRVLTAARTDSGSTQVAPAVSQPIMARVWEFEGSDVPAARMILEPDGSMSIHGGVEARGPMRWKYDRAQHLLIVTLPPSTRQDAWAQECISSMLAHRSILRYDRAANALHYAFTDSTRYLEYMGFNFYRQ